MPNLRHLLAFSVAWWQVLEVRSIFVENNEVCPSFRLYLCECGHFYVESFDASLLECFRGQMSMFSGYLCHAGLLFGYDLGVAGGVSAM